jgi:hypothetical protein
LWERTGTRSNHFLAAFYLGESGSRRSLWAKFGEADFFGARPKKVCVTLRPAREKCRVFGLGRVGGVEFFGVGAKKSRPFFAPQKSQKSPLWDEKVALRRKNKWQAGSLPYG